MTSATEHLRALLTERGVGWTTASGSACYTAWATERGIAQATDYGEDGGVLSVLFRCVPAQAIDATLGRGTCHIDLVGYDEREDRFQCRSCDWSISVRRGTWPRFNYCPNCGRKVVE